ncbi:MAG: hypothetical protein JJU29_11570 [Verrucomicrobia bacterium]|nr:hypothetical protein [Verrucomicrobiota bacterium]MCH8512973.1 hypothetical protein [Kiritimatiellia bacterium]
MTDAKGSAFDFIERLKRQAPEILDLLTAETVPDFDKAFDAWLERAVMRLEQNKKNYEKLGEEGLTSALAGELRMPGLSVHQEENSNGHVDITIESTCSSPVFRKLGEAKIYDGPKYHIKGLVQLLDRYSTGRETRGLVLAYVRKKDIANLMKGIQKEMNSELPLDQQGETRIHALKWSFISSHKHSCGDVVDVAHIGCNLY